MPLDLAAIATEEKRRPLDAIVNGDGTPDIAYLDRLRSASLPLLRRHVDGLQDELGLLSQISLKKAATAQEKCLRPSTLAKYPWFEICHLRDYLRFRTLLYRASDFEDVLTYFLRAQDAGEVSIVKVDTAKLARPGAFGWRMIAVDLRIAATGMLVEHYMTFREMIEVNEAWLHRVYEAWRSASPDDMTVEELRAFDCDATFSRHAYRELLFDGILREQPAGSTAAAQRKIAAQAVLGALTATLTLG